VISRWAGQCSLCGRSIPKGADVHYTTEAKTVEHWECLENPQPGPEDFALADRLGYLPTMEAECADWPALCRDRPMPDLSPSDRGIADRRPEPAARPRRQSTLFGG
jgi:hypothetical protein